jgi:hypothetical protein
MRSIASVPCAARCVRREAPICSRFPENQPTLLDDVTLLFTDPPPGERFLSAHTVTKHSGRLEERRLRASASLATYLREAGWADVGLVLEVETVVRWPTQPARSARRELR